MFGAKSLELRIESPAGLANLKPPKPETLNPKPEALNPRPYPRLETANPKAVASFPEEHHTELASLLALVAGVLVVQEVFGGSGSLSQHRVKGLGSGIMGHYTSTR